MSADHSAVGIGRKSLMSGIGMGKLSDGMSLALIQVDCRDIVRLVLSLHEGKKFNELYIGKDGRIYEGV